MENAFYFILKALFVLKILFILIMQENGLIRKLWLVSKFMTLYTGKQIIHYTYCPISQEAKVIMKFAQLTEYSKRNIFLKILEKLSPHPFLKHQD